MKRITCLVLAAAMIFGAATGANAIDFKMSGEWLMGFSAAESSLVSKLNGKKANNDDKFQAGQRLRLKLEAAANENLSGTVYFEIGDTNWGKSDEGGSLGADGKIVELKNAYIDWAVPDTELKVRMGIQALTFPCAAGGSAILDDDVASVVASYKINENVGVTLLWARPFNDNYSQEDSSSSAVAKDRDNFLDNVDLISLAVPLTFDGIETTPWVMYGLIGSNAFRNDTGYNYFFTSDYSNSSRWNGDGTLDRRKNAYSHAFWAGLPVKLSLWDPINVEFDINYGYMGSTGRGTLTKSNGTTKRFSTKAEGWVAKALVEYKMDWGTPGILGWYASGDDSNPKNGSERMPSISACNLFTSFMGDDSWNPDSSLYDRQLSFSGTWGLGVQVADMSFLEDLTHTFRAVYWGGTNSPSMAKYASIASAWGYDESGDKLSDMYLTTNDGILEFNLINKYQMYENFEINLELGYLVNFIDHDTWEKAGTDNHFKKQDAWKAQVVFGYTF